MDGHEAILLRERESLDLTFREVDLFARYGSTRRGKIASVYESFCLNLQHLRVDLRSDDSRLALPPCAPRSEERPGNCGEPTGRDLRQLVEPKERRHATVLRVARFCRTARAARSERSNDRPG